MTVEEVVKKFGFEIKEVKPDYYRILNPREISITEFGGCFNKCALVYTDEANVVDERNCIIDERGTLQYFTPFLDVEHNEISSIAKANGLTEHYYKAYNHEFKEEIISVFSVREM